MVGQVLQVVQDELFDQDEAKIEVEERRVGPAVQEPARHHYHHNIDAYDRGLYHPMPQQDVYLVTRDGESSPLWGRTVALSSALDALADDEERYDDTNGGNSFHDGDDGYDVDDDDEPTKYSQYPKILGSETAKKLQGRKGLKHSAFNYLLVHHRYIVVNNSHPSHRLDLFSILQKEEKTRSPPHIAKK